MPDGNVAAARTVFLRYAERFAHATTSDIASAIADAAGEAIAKAYLSPAPDTAAAFGDLQRAIRQEVARG